MSSDIDLLAATLTDEHAAVYAYGVLGARLDDRTRAVALAAFDAHRERRDELTARLRAAGHDPAGPLPAYDVTVAGRADALALAVRVEEALAVRWRDLVVGTTTADLRRLGVGGLSDSAVRAATWRRLAGTVPVTVALPGTG